MGSGTQRRSRVRKEIVIPDDLWQEMRYCLEEEISMFKPDDDGDLAMYPELTQEQVPLLQLMIAYEHHKNGFPSKILKRYGNWLADMLSNYSDEGVYSPEEGQEAKGDPEAWVGRLETLLDRLAALIT